MMAEENRMAPGSAKGNQADKHRLIQRAFLQAIVLLPFLGVATFIPAATLAWPQAWALLSIYIVGLLSMNLWLIARHPGLAQERLIIPRSSERWDIRLIQIANVLLLGILLPLSGLDHRFGWSPSITSGVSLFMLFLFAALFVFMGWSMSVNDYFSSAIRLQIDRGQTVATQGPYRRIRHPGYLAMILQCLTIPFILGSLWALFPAAAVGILYLYRTDREDKFLQEKLPGYAEYIRRVPYRLIPGIW
jgi:protein-S-isoprenylcysteine O-methyltransferase Ste14